jgi:hypothetical protein
VEVGINANKNFVRRRELKKSVWLPLLDFKEMTRQCVEWVFGGGGAQFYPLNTELNHICHLLALLGVHHIFHISRIRVNVEWWTLVTTVMHPPPQQIEGSLLTHLTTVSSSTLNMFD